jgi:hypothetical protein
MLCTRETGAPPNKSFGLAIELNPNSQDAHFMYAGYLISLKRNQEWQTEIQNALALDPMTIVRTRHSMALLCNRLPTQPAFT